MLPAPTLTCEVCGKEEALGVGAMPGVPGSFAYGRSCLEANAHPYGIVVANSAMIGGLDGAAGWWIDIVNSTLAHLQISREQFDRDLEVASRQLEGEES